ncbi:hypothetical protein Ccrd_010123 [Cynara cardunculus var. scolymus]|uniref:Uncharacterized protein n=1 Tax=Cynara cardunculus var. scolymus TaxID=59895 RepID=A0A118K703_CYNCS|nr:hypothetical protein Ccrd_010123 [Cynara cardunculus var. scolymus]
MGSDSDANSSGGRRSCFFSLANKPTTMTRKAFTLPFLSVELGATPDCESVTKHQTKKGNSGFYKLPFLHARSECASCAIGAFIPKASISIE